ncbi:MAG: hypothetical protein ACM3TR_12215 [Caulobacteraceae bacterium]
MKCKNCGNFKENKTSDVEMGSELTPKDGVCRLNGKVCKASDGCAIGLSDKLGPM